MKKEKINDFIQNYNQKKEILHNIDKIKETKKEIKLNILKIILLILDFILIVGFSFYINKSLAGLEGSENTQYILIFMAFIFSFILLLGIAFNIIKFKTSYSKQKLIISNKKRENILKEIKKDQLTILNENELIKELLLNDDIDIVELNNKNEIYEKVYNTPDLLILIKETNITKIKNDFNKYMEEKNNTKRIDNRLNSLKGTIEIN